MKFRLIAVLGLVLLSSIGFADSANLVLNAKEGQSWYLLHNKGKQTVWLNAVIKNPGASAGWSSKLDAGQYSLLALNKQQLAFACGINVKKAFQNLSCSKLVQSKQVEVSATTNNQNASFWAVENVPLPELKSSAAQRGIKIK